VVVAEHFHRFPVVAAYRLHTFAVAVVPTIVPKKIDQMDSTWLLSDDQKKLLIRLGATIVKTGVALEAPSYMKRQTIFKQKSNRSKAELQQQGEGGIK
jgi:hypothetical protein